MQHSRNHRNLLQETQEQYTEKHTQINTVLVGVTQNSRQEKAELRTQKLSSMVRVVHGSNPWQACERQRLWGGYRTSRRGTGIPWAPH